MKPKFVIPKGVGINSQDELGTCFELAGAEVMYVHLNYLIDYPELLDQVQGAGFAGGFAMGDLPWEGQSPANRVRLSALRGKLEEKLDDETFPIISICNSLQIFAKLGLFPIPVGTTKNDVGKHMTSYWDLAVDPNCPTVWLKYLQGYEGEPIFAPISHGGGRIHVSPEDLAKAQGLVALRYTDGHVCEIYRSSRGHQYNPNGSVDDIAAFGWQNNLAIFPHFERVIRDCQRMPDRHEVKERKGTTNQLYEPTHLIFKAAVDFVDGK